MKRVLRGCRATAVALAVCGLTPAHAANLVWQFSQDEESAFLGVVDAAAANKDAPDYLFYMACAATGDETTVVSDLDAKALGQAIASGKVPSFSYVLDGEAQPDTGGEPADIRFDEMVGAWQYISGGADYDLLLTASAIKITGVGVDLTLPEKDLTTSLQQLKDACDKLVSAGDEGTDTGQ